VLWKGTRIFVWFREIPGLRSETWGTSPEVVRRFD
jgi:hypothetical protein